MTRDEFIERSVKVHGDRYSYDKLPLEFGSKDIVVITCPVHGDFEQCAKEHYRKDKPHGCPKCGNGRKGRVMDTETFVTRYRERFGNDLDLSKVEYRSFDEEVTVICPRHGEFKTTPHSLMRGHGCPECGKEKASNRRRLGADEFIRRSREVHGDRYDYSNVRLERLSDKVEIICQEHGPFTQVASKHLGGQGCPKCARGKVSLSQAKGTEKFIEESRAKFGDKFSYDRTSYESNKKKVIVTCPVHGDVEMLPNSHLSSDTGCRLCSIEAFAENTRKSKEYFVEKAREIHGDLYGYDNFEYVNWHTPGYVTCRTHGDFLVTPSNHVTNGSGCPKCVSFISRWESEVYDFITSLGIEAEKTNRTILNGNEIDIYIPSLSIGIECDGLHWHSEKYLDKEYHLRKTMKSMSKGVRLIHIFEDEWKHKRAICESMIRNILNMTSVRYYARKCEIREVSPSDKVCFLNENHIQGNAASKVNVGLYYEGELVSLMTFGKPRINLGGDRREGNYELVRFCNKLGTTVVGGASRLLKWFLDKYKPMEIVSYSDKRWSVGKLYEMLGFEHVHDSRPNYFYVVGMRRLNRFMFRKDALVKQGFDETKGEHEIMLGRGVYRIYDCGTMVWKFRSADIYNM